MGNRARIVVDGEQFDTLEGFYEHFSIVALEPGIYWGKNLDAFNDVLRGGFGTPEGGFVLEWRSHAVSRQRLGFEETIRQLELRRWRCHPSNIPHVDESLSQARSEQGDTVFDWIVEIIREHGPGGSEAEDCVDLILA